MITYLIDIGDSKGVAIPDELIKKYELENVIEINPLSGGIFISKKRKAREGWEEQMKSSILAGDLPDTDPFENLANSWDENEWTWPE